MMARGRNFGRGGAGTIGYLTKVSHAATEISRRATEKRRRSPWGWNAVICPDDAHVFFHNSEINDFLLYKWEGGMGGGVRRARAVKKHRNFF